MKELKGEVTAFLSLIILLMLSFVAALMESASLQVSKNLAKADVDRALDCVFAEYHSELFAKYHIFSCDLTYETGDYKDSNLINRLNYYGGSGQQKIEKIQYLSDALGQPFYEQAVQYEYEKHGLGAIEKMLGNTWLWEEQEELEKGADEQEKGNQEELDEMLSKEEMELPQKDNPIRTIQELKKRDILELVMPKERAVSEKTINREQLPSYRNLHAGKGSFPDEIASGISGSAAKVFFGEYLMEHFKNAAKEGDGALNYEMEYILQGQESDRENLKQVVHRLIAFRFGANYTFLLRSPGKQSEARTLALTLTTAIALPIAEELVTQAILLAWAFGESVMDIRTLLAGEKVPLAKTEENWRLGLPGLLKLGTETKLNAIEDTKLEDTKIEEGEKEMGLSYEDYLRILLYLKNTKELTMRGLDLIESNMKQSGAQYFQVDTCMNRLQLQTKKELRRGIRYDFHSYYAYE